MIALIDYEAGNIQSVKNALNQLNCDFVLTDDHDLIRKAEKVIFPGVGHAGAAMDALANKGLVEVIKGLIQPVLGICVGMQVYCESSEEGDTPCLGIIPGKVTRFNYTDLKVPHMGWNQVTHKRESPLFDRISDNEYFYFVHSYYVPDSEYSIGNCIYGDEKEKVTFSAVVQKDNFYGIQFHAEKSGNMGGLLIENFLRIKG